MKRAVIIHLSDIHYDGSESSYTLIQQLQADLEEMRQNFDTEYNAIIITGDCINKGHTELYSEFSERLDDIAKVCGLRKDHVVIVPGNHDSDRDNKWLKAIKEKYGKDQEKIVNDIKDDISPLYKEYNEFIAKYSKQNNGIGVKDYTCNDMKIRVVFLNSSWSTLADCKYGELYIGDEQLEKIKSIIDNRKQKCDVMIACLHHPLDWFKYDERVKLQDFLYNKLNVNLILHGHIHEASYDSISNMDINSNTFCTGISYHKTGEDCSRKDGMRYSIYEIDYDTHTVNVYLRATNQKGKFISDNRLYSKVNKNGFFTLPLGNINQCIMPIKSVDDSKRNNIFLSKTFVKRLIDKEELLFRFYCGMEENLENSIQKDIDNQFRKYKENWKKQYNKKNLSKNDREKCEKDFYKEQFELYCMFVLNTLNGLFFKNHKHVRFLLRRYNKLTNSHEAIFAEGIYSQRADIEKIKAFKWGEGMICKSYEKKAALLQSRNMAYHEQGNTQGIWKDYLTLAISGIEIRKGNEFIPLLSLNIATDSIENEDCLQALAVSSIYDKIQEVFKLFTVKVYDLISLYNE